MESFLHEAEKPEKTERTGAPEVSKEARETYESLFADELKEAGAAKDYGSLDEMKNGLEKSYGEIKEDKPPNSPNLAKWFDNGGTIRVEENSEKSVWTYIDKEDKEVSYIDGYPQFPPEAKHPVISDISIGKFTGDRNEDKMIYLEKLEESYGLTEIPEGYALHHDCQNGNMQLVRMDYHSEFTHAGGHSLFREG